MSDSFEREAVWSDLPGMPMSGADYMADELINGQLESLVRPTPQHLTTAQQYARAFSEGAMEQFDRVIAGEEDAKLLTAAGFLMGGENASLIAFYGLPGTGKSRFMKYAHRIVGGLTDEMVGNVPHREDLSPAELVGKKSELVRDLTYEDGTTSRETLGSDVRGIIRPGIAVLKFDEGNRTSPVALNAVLELTQDGSIAVEHQGTTEDVSEFDLIVMGMNHYGTLFTHRFDPALVSRLAYGIEFGRRQRGHLSEGAEAVWDNLGRYTGTPNIEPVISRANLRILRRFVELQPISPAMADLGKVATVTMVDGFADHNLQIGDARLAQQLIRGSQALSLARGEERVTPQDMLDIAGTMILAKFGATGLTASKTNSSLVEPAQEIVNKIKESIEPGQVATHLQPQPRPGIFKRTK